MKQLNLKFPKTGKINKFNSIDLDPNYKKNVLNIEGNDYFVNYIDSKTKKNKGANSYILTLTNIQEYEIAKEVGEELEPEYIIKICKFQKYKDNTITKRFDNEINALADCNKRKFQHVIRASFSGSIEIPKENFQGKIGFPKYQYYIMEYGEYDLKQYIEFKDLKIYDRILLALDICHGLQELYEADFFHRDLKPDNIFFIEETWKIGDLGLSDHRYLENIDNPNELIGPKGWYSPEAMNKYLTKNKGFKYKFDCYIDHQSDIFQIGQILWYILQGNAPVGSVKEKDFKINDSQLFAILKTMLNHSKQKRYNKIEEISKLLKPIHSKYYKIDI